MEMGERIKQLRTEKCMTLEELGNKVGVGKSTVRKWEIGMIENMKRDKISKLAKALDVSPAYLMGYEERVDYSYLDTIIESEPNSEKRNMIFEEHLLHYAELLSKLNKEHKDKILHDIEYYTEQEKKLGK